MVTFSSITNDWPWNPQAPKDLSDKEILTHIVHLDDTEKTWLLPLYQCLPGYAYVGFRVVPFHPVTPSQVSLQAGLGRQHALFGPLYDTQAENISCSNWTLLKMPIPHQLCGLDEDELHLRVEFPSATWGKVEFLAQRVEDLPADETLLDYWYPCANNAKGCWVHTRRNRFYWLESSVRENEYPHAIGVPLLRA